MLFPITGSTECDTKIGRTVYVHFFLNLEDMQNNPLIMKDFLEKKYDFSPGHYGNGGLVFPLGLPVFKLTRYSH